MMKNTLLFAILLLVSSGLHAQTSNTQKLDSLFQKIGTNNKGMGTFSLFKDGKEVYQKAFGYADVENQQKADAKTKYRIGSISKTFTAVIIMQLVDEGKLTLATKLDKYFPQIPNSEKITIEQLLRHQSGLFSFTSTPDYTSWMTKPKSREEMLRMFVDNATVFEPGEKNEYSNTNYVLLSFIAEELDEKRFPDIVQLRIIKPCKLETTFYGEKINPKNDEALSYARKEEWQLQPETDMSIPVGAGAIVSTATDLNTFFSCLFGGKLVSDTSLSKMKDIKNNYGMGLFPLPFYKMKGFGHTGGIDGFQSMASYFPEEGIAVSYISNGVVMPVNDIMIAALSIYLGMDYELPGFKPALTLKPEDLDSYLGVYSSPAFPLKITITKNENILIAQATGQASIPLEAFEKDKFRFQQANLVLEFKPSENQVLLLQNGMRFELTKE